MSNAPREIVKEVIERRIKELLTEIERKENIIKMAQELLRQL